MLIAFLLSLSFFGILIFGSPFYLKWLSEWLTGRKKPKAIPICGCCDGLIRNKQDRRKTRDGEFCHEWCEYLLED